MLVQARKLVKHRAQLCQKLNLDFYELLLHTQNQINQYQRNSKSSSDYEGNSAIIHRDFIEIIREFFAREFTAFDI